MLGYDIDGVLITDLRVDFNKPLEEVQWLLDARHHLVPTFLPAGNFVLITARPMCEERATLDWSGEFFRDCPPRQVVFSGNDHTMSTAEVVLFKATVCLEIGVRKYIESNERIVQGMNEIFEKEDSRCQAILFRKVIQDQLQLFGACTRIPEGKVW